MNNIFFQEHAIQAASALVEILRQSNPERYPNQVSCFYFKLNNGIVVNFRPWSCWSRKHSTLSAIHNEFRWIQWARIRYIQLWITSLFQMFTKQISIQMLCALFSILYALTCISWFVITFYLFFMYTNCRKTRDAICRIAQANRAFEAVMYVTCNAL